MAKPIPMWMSPMRPAPGHAWRTEIMCDHTCSVTRRKRVFVGTPLLLCPSLLFQFVRPSTLSLFRPRTLSRPHERRRKKGGRETMWRRMRRPKSSPIPTYPNVYHNLQLSCWINHYSSQYGSEMGSSASLMLLVIVSREILS